MIIQGDCHNVMQMMPDESVDLVITSPPYWNLRDYSYWPTYDEYIDDNKRWFGELGRVVKKGRHVCWNIQPYLPTKISGVRYHHALSADIIQIACNSGFMLERTLIWNKRDASQRMFGSYPYPPTIIYTPTIEDIHVFRKMGKADLSSKSDSSKITLDEWKEWTLPIWDISTAKNPNHPAVFPIEIPRRLIKLHSFVGDLVMDPFAGSGTTGRAAVETGREFLLIERDSNYINLCPK